MNNKHPRNKAERLLLNSKKDKKRKTPMRNVEVSIDNINSAVESFLFSMHLIDANEKVLSVSQQGDTFFVSLERLQEDTNN